jgi:thioredoxin 1
MKQITSHEFKNKIENGEKFLVDLFATWCMPCKVMINNLESIESESIESGVNFYKYDVESDMEFSRGLGVRSVPTVKLFKEGREVFSKTGVIPSDQIKMEISKY